MASIPIVSSADGPRITVNELIKSPTVIPKRILDMTHQMFFIDRLLRGGMDAPGGVVAYHESSPLFATASDGTVNVPIVGEGGEIPVSSQSEGVPATVRTVKRGMGMVITDEMVRRSNTDRVNINMLRIRNTFAATYNALFLSSLLGNANVPTRAVAGAWNLSAASAAGQGILYDVAQTIYNIQNQDTDSANGTGVQKLGFNPDTIVMHPKMATFLLTSPDIAKVLGVGNVANLQPQIRGDYTVTPPVFYGLDVITSWQLNPDKVIILEKNTVGFIADEVPMQATALYRQEDNQRWRSNVTRVSGVGIDQPKAAAVLTNVGGGTITGTNFPTA